MVISIAWEIRFFLVVLFAVLAGFAHAFWLLSNTDNNLLFGNVQKALYNSFFFMLGQGFDLTTFDDVIIPEFAQLLLVFFLMMMMILMLNLLIALMGDAFSAVRARGPATWRKEQASIIFDQAFFTDPKILQRIPPYLHILKYTSDVGMSGSGSNKLSEVVEITRQHVLPYSDLDSEGSS